jgi:hypothetical protein
MVWYAVGHQCSKSATASPSELKRLVAVVCQFGDRDATSFVIAKNARWCNTIPNGSWA